MTLPGKLTGRRIAELQSTARARYIGETKDGVKQAQAISLLVQHSIPGAKRVLIYTTNGKLAAKMNGTPSGRGLELLVLGKWWRQMRPVRAERAQPVADQRASRRAALLKMRTLWNASDAATGREAAEDGVEYQKRLRAEW